MAELNRAKFTQRYQNIELDLRDSQVIQILKQAGLDNNDLHALTSKDGHRLAFVNGKLKEVSNASRNQKINAEEAYLFFEEKDKNGTWASVNPDDPTNPNRHSLQERIDALSQLFEHYRTNSSNNNDSPSNKDTSTVSPGNVPHLADVDLDTANDFFKQNPYARYDRQLSPSWYRFNPLKGPQVLHDHSIRDTIDVVSKLSEIGGVWEKVLTQVSNEDEIRPIAYNNKHKTHQSDICRFIQPGEWYIGMSHHNNSNRKITRQKMQDDVEGIELLKLNISHIRNYIGIRHNDGSPGIVSIDSPRSYATNNDGGVVNPKDYPSVLWRVTFDDSISAAEQRAYINNIRTWCMLFNKITKFPPEYNGKDNLMTNSYQKIVQFGQDVINALDGSGSALSSLHGQSQQVYCSESGIHLALNLGLNLPLNQATISQVYGQSIWNTVKDIIQHADNFWKNGKYPDYYGYGSDGYTQNSQQNRLIDMELAPEWLKPLKERMPDRNLHNDLAFKPWNSADMIEYFIKTAVPREGRESWDVANAQAELLTWAKPGIFFSMGFTPSNPPPPPLVMLFDTLIAKVRQVYPSYADFRQAIAPELAAAHKIVAPKAKGEGAFVPPHIVFSIKGEADDLIGLEIVGQLIHEDALERI
jgi:hypothetical protein